MVTIKTSEVKKFINAAKPIKENHLLPIYSYIKLECDGDSSVFYKSNGQAFVCCLVKSEFKKNCTFIIEQKTLFGFVNYSSGDEIKIEESDGKIIISDSTKNISCQSIADDYPKIQKKEDGEQFALDQDVITSLFLAKNHSMVNNDRELRAWMSFVHVAKVGELFYVLGFNGIICYMKSYTSKLPLIALDPEYVGVISRFSQLIYSQSGNYDHFDAGEVSYGFIKSETICPGLTPVLERMKSEDSMIIERKKILDFCEMVVNVSNSAIPPLVSIEDVDKNNVFLKYSDALSNKDAEEKIETKEKNFTIKDFFFQPNSMVMALKDLGFENIKLSYATNNLVITSQEDKNYIGAIMEIANLSEKNIPAPLVVSTASGLTNYFIDGSYLGVGYEHEKDLLMAGYFD